MNAKHTPDLLSCPFCGGKAMSEGRDGGASFQRIRCTGCSAMTGYYAVNHGADLAKAWNRRAPKPEHKKALEYILRVARDRTEPAWYRLSTIADEAKEALSKAQVQS